MIKKSLVLASVREYVFLRFFSKSKKMTFYVLLVAALVFSNTGASARKWYQTNTT